MRYNLNIKKIFILINFFIMIKCHNSCQYLQMIAKLVEVIFLQKQRIYLNFCLKIIHINIISALVYIK